MKTILITGGARGLGSELAMHFHHSGYRVLVLDRVPPHEVDKSTAASIDAYHEVDLADKDAVTRTIADVRSKESTIDVLVLNAAVRAFKPFAEFTDDEIERSIDVNLRGSMYIIRGVLPHLEASGRGRIVFISSMSAFDGYAGGTLYCSTKAAMIPLAQSLALDLRSTHPFVTVNVICPDSFATREGERLASYDRIVRGVVDAVGRFIATEINGTVVPVASPSRHVYEFLRQVKVNFLRFFLSR